MIEAEVSIDEGETWIKAWVRSDQDNWNGWANPYFDHSQVDDLVKHWTESAGKMGVPDPEEYRMERVLDELVIHDPNYATPTTIIPRDGMYYLGGGFCWMNRRVHG